MWLQFANSNKPGDLNYEWYKKTVRAITTFDGKTSLNQDEQINFIRFGMLIDRFYFPDEYYPDLDLRQVDVEQLLKLNQLDMKGRTIKKKYTNVSAYTSVQFCGLLKEVVHEDEWVFIHYVRHVIGLFKHGDYYYLNDPSDNKGVYQLTSAEEIAQIVFDNPENPNNDNHQIPLPLGIAIFGDSGINYTYPNPREFAAKVQCKFHVECINISCLLGCVESLKFQLDKKVEIVNDQTKGTPFPIFIMLLSHKSSRAAMIAELLARGADPNMTLAVEGMEYYYTSTLRPYFDNNGSTILQVASARGDVAVVRVLLSDKRTDVNKKNVRNYKTALMFAKENKHPEIQELLLAKGAQE